jgi:elongation factor P
MATTADFRNGMCIEFNGQLFFIIQFQHVKPGKGPAFVRTKLKNVSTGKVIDNTFSCRYRDAFNGEFATVY